MICAKSDSNSSSPSCAAAWGIVSVVIPCYRQAHFLPESIASLQAQTYPHWEALVVDDGSPDDTAAVTERLARTDRRIRLVRKANGGLSSARNAGLAAATGRWVQFLDADDLLLPRKLELQLQLMQNAPSPVFSYTDYWHGAEDNPMQPVGAGRLSCRFTAHDPVCELAWRWETDLSIPIHAALFDAYFFNELGLRFDEELPNHEDWDMWMRVAGVAREIHFVDDVLACYRYSRRSMSRDRAVMWQGFRLAVQKQRALNRHRPEVVRLLDSKLRLIDWTYGKGWRAKAAGWLAGSIRGSELMPWRLRMALRGLLEPTSAAWSRLPRSATTDPPAALARGRASCDCRVVVHSTGANSHQRTEPQS